MPIAAEPSFICILFGFHPTLEFTGAVHTVRCLQFDFLSMLERSSCSLESFSLRGIHVPDATLIECQEYMPLLRKFVLWHEPHLSFGLVRPISDELLVRLTSEHHRPSVLVPELEHLELRNVNFNNNNLLADMVESQCVFLEGQTQTRMRGLQYLTVQFRNGDLEPGATTRLRNCRGLTLKILDR